MYQRTLEGIRYGGHQLLGAVRCVEGTDFDLNDVRRCPMK